ncbi:hypothetical protein B484DRAFT_232390 [Ochromonadaceae sp. CCMP2298]|nr:hypothetical protein B484DRAFT_232390 [Ochromonadaceae sp. CCMP2298]
MYLYIYTGTAGVNRALCSIVAFRRVSNLNYLFTAFTVFPACCCCRLPRASKPRSSYIFIHVGLYTVCDEPYW